MSVTSGFFNSINGDRRYNAEQMSSIFDGIINDGIFANIGTAFMVEAKSGNDITVGIGRAWFNSTWLYNDAILPLTADDSDILLNRYDAVVIEIDHSVVGRDGTIKIIKGTAATDALYPALVKTNEIHQYPLAYIYRPADSTEIRQANITNMVGTSSAPYVTGILQVQNIDNIVAQWQAEFYDWNIEKQNEFIEWVTSVQREFNDWETVEKSEFDRWFANIRNQLSEDAAGNLQNQINNINPETIGAATPDYVDQQIALVTETGIPKLMVYPLPVVAEEDGQTVFNINLGTFDYNTDTVIVQYGRTILSPNRDFSIVGKTVVLNEGAPLGRTLDIYVFKNIPLGDDGSVSGIVIAPETLPLNRLERMPTASEVGAAPSSHGNHVPATETANNAKFLRNDNTWQTVTPGNIGAAAISHTHGAGDINSGTLGVARGGTGGTTFTAGQAIIGNGTGAFQGRAISNVTTNTTCAASTNLITANTLNYHVITMLNRDTTVTAAETNYSHYKARGFALVTSTPSSITNGCCAFVYA